MTTNTNILDLFQRIDPRDITAALGLDDPQCSVEGCHTKHAGFGIGFNTAGEIGVAPICRAHAEAGVTVYHAYSFDAFEGYNLLRVCCNVAAERLQAADSLPYIARLPAALECAGLHFRDKLGRLGYVPILLPVEEGDMLVAHAPDLQFMVDNLLGGQTLSFMCPAADHRLRMQDSSMKDFVPLPGKSIEPAELLAAVAAGGVHHIDIKHDDDCPTLKTGSGADCTCSPDVELRK